VISRRLLTAALAAVLLGATRAPLIVYQAPAGSQPAGVTDARRPFDAILPSGRAVSPFGTSVGLGGGALGLTLTPNGRFAIVSDPQTIRVIDTRTLQPVDARSYRPNYFFAGLVTERDPADPTRTIVLAPGGANNAVRVLDVSDAGTLTDEPSVPILLPNALALSADGRYAYVAGGNNALTAIDLVGRRVLHVAGVGFSPAGVVADGNRILVTNEGLMNYSPLQQLLRVPPFAGVPSDLRDASSLAAVATLDGDVVPDAATSAFTPLDGTPDNLRIIGGAHPTAIAVTPDHRYAFVCLTNIDRLAIVALTGTPRVVGGLSLQLFAGSPFGTQPSALALNRSGTRLYVALAGINAIAPIDVSKPLHPRRLGLIPSGSDPIALALSADDRELFVANAQGNGELASLQRVELRHLHLTRASLSALAYTRTASHAVSNAIVPPLRSLRASAAIKHVVLILEESKTFDAMLGDLTDETGAAHGNGDARFVAYGADVTPNLHALARTFAVADNVYSSAANSDAGHQIAAGGVATAYTSMAALLGRHAQDPEDYPRAGYIFNALARSGARFRDYGELVRLSGYAADSRARSGMGGLYSLDVPALAALNGSIDTNYPGWNPAIGDLARAREFTNDFDRYVQSDQAPAFTYIWLPGDATLTQPQGSSPDRQQVAEGDRALGTIVAYLTHTPQWNSMAIFILPSDSGMGVMHDHVNAHRIYAVVVSPFARHGYVGHQHLSSASVLKTEEELLGLPPLALNDLLATDMADFFDPTPDATAFSAEPASGQTGQAAGSAR
jgi:hypothetical protein